MEKHYIAVADGNILQRLGFDFNWRLFKPSYHYKRIGSLELRVYSDGVIGLNDLDGEMTKILLEFYKANLDAYPQKDYMRFYYRPSTYSIQMGYGNLISLDKWYQIIFLKEDMNIFIEQVEKILDKY